VSFRPSCTETSTTTTFDLGITPHANVTSGWDGSGICFVQSELALAAPEWASYYRAWCHDATEHATSPNAAAGSANIARETLCGTMRRLPNGRQLFHGLPEKAVLVQSDNAVKRVSEYSSQSIRNCCNASFHRCVGKPVAMQLHNLFDITASTWHAIWERYRNV
jgi:hypothetical protein